MIDDQPIYEPVQEYDKYNGINSKVIKDHFNMLVSKSKIDIEANKNLVESIKEQRSRIERINRRDSIFEFISRVISIFIIIDLLFFIGNVWYLIKQKDKLDSLVHWIFIAVLVGLLFLIFLFLRFYVISKKIEEIRADLYEAKEQLEYLINEGIEQTSYLTELISTQGTKKKIIQESIPIIKFKLLTKAEETQLEDEYGFVLPKDLKQTTCLNFYSGSIYGNPFILIKNLNYKIENKTYEGYTGIEWIEYYRNKKGEQDWFPRSETLSETIEKPCVEFYDDVMLVVGTNAAKNLMFERSKRTIDLPEAWQNKITRERNLNSKIQDTNNLPPLINTRFKNIWATFKRSNEREFRSLFTPLTQKNLMDILDDKRKGYGDCVDIIKNKRNLIFFSKLLDELDFDDQGYGYSSYNIKEIERSFYNTNKRFFKSIYWIFAPFFSIPGFYNFVIDNNNNNNKDKQFECLSDFEYEVCVNNLPSELIKHEKIETNPLNKIKFLSIKDSWHNILVKSTGFDTIERVEHFSVPGGDGNCHDVSVEWPEFIKCVKHTLVKIKPFEELITNKFWFEKGDKELEEDRYITPLGIVEVEEIDDEDVLDIDEDVDDTFDDE
ncbi:MAG1210 family protein [Mycoplasma yeatsii]|uniref:Uncharacterized protein n=1 Tax=Mycoplasma yeatsii TaxID=51365 RepID=A0ABU0NEA8_9MOLU|nr:hypothetical protein [Mycoplasma yeatsii]MDQ0567786.1 hypothetical protein [Mycoplasma yeatsii]